MQPSTTGKGKGKAKPWMLHAEGGIVPETGQAWGPPWDTQAPGMDAIMSAAMSSSAPSTPTRDATMSQQPRTPPVHQLLATIQEQAEMQLRRNVNNL